MTELEDDTIALMSRRALDVAGTISGVVVYLNGKKLSVTGFKSYVEQYVKDITDDNDEPLKVIYEKVNPRWEIALTVSEKGFQQVSFVNGIASTKGGRHVDHVAGKVVSHLLKNIKEKVAEDKIKVKPSHIKSYLWVFVNCLIKNPTFDGETKETMTLQSKDFGSQCDITETFLKDSLSKCGVVEAVMNKLRGVELDFFSGLGGKTNTVLQAVVSGFDVNVISWVGDSARHFRVNNWDGLLELAKQVEMNGGDEAPTTVNQLELKFHENAYFKETSEPNEYLFYDPHK